MQTAGMDFREALMILKMPQQGIGADLTDTDMYSANSVGLLFFIELGMGAGARNAWEPH